MIGKPQSIYRLLDKISSEVEAGATISSAFKNNTGALFTSEMVSIISAGEETDNLPQALNMLADYSDEKLDLKEKTDSIFIYPTIIVVAAIAVVTFIMNYILPMLTLSIKGSGGELPPETRILLSISAFFQNNLPVILITLTAAITLYKLFSMSKRGGVKIDRIKLYSPVSGRCRRISVSDEFVNTIYILMQSGLKMQTAIKTAAETCKNRYIKVRLEEITKHIDDGADFVEKLADIRELHPLLIMSFETGAISGDFKKSLSNCRAFYRKEISRENDRMLRIAEPMLTIILALVVGFVVIAIYKAVIATYNI